MKNIHIVLVSAGYGSQDLTNLLECQKFKDTKELKDAIIQKIGGEPNELEDEQILVYQLNEFTQAVNDQVLDDLSNYFIFAVEITGEVLDEKQFAIDRINLIISKFGLPDLGDESFKNGILFNQINKNHQQMIELISPSGVTVTEYVNDIDTNEFDVDFEGLPIDLLNEILLIMEEFEASELKLEGRIKDNNY